MTLRDALAAALERTLDPALRWTPGSTKSMCLDLSGRLLADPAFREALVEAVGDALEKVDVASGYRLSSITPPMGPVTLAAAIVDRMLP